MSRITRHFEENIVSKLKCLRGFSDLSSKTGLSESTIRKLAKGKNTNPTIKVVDALDNALCEGSEFLTQGGVQPEMEALSGEPVSSSPIQDSRG